MRKSVEGMSVYLAATIAAAALLLGSAVIALAIVRQTAQRRDVVAPARGETDGARSPANGAVPAPSASEERDDRPERPAQVVAHPQEHGVTLF